MPAPAAAVPSDLSAAAGAADARASASALLYPDDFETASDIHVRDEPPPRHTSYAEIIKDKRPRKARVGGATAAGSAHSSPSSSDGVDVAFLGLEPTIDDAFFDDVGPPAYYVDPMALGDSSSDEEVLSIAIAVTAAANARMHRHGRTHAHAGAEIKHTSRMRRARSCMAARTVCEAWYGGCCSAGEPSSKPRGARRLGLGQ
jgi:hypothetical protein